uniref:Uncharacterized protein n=1 Tax=Rhizophora mucronata TaxID=61149 RepID=A0A2P2R1X0_RHIMU
MYIFETKIEIKQKQDIKGLN